MAEIKIATILPAREGFSPKAFGAISLTIRDFIDRSAYKNTSYTYGLVDAPAFDGFHYQPLTLKRRWYEPQTRAYVREVLAALKTQPVDLVEVHNRPNIALQLASKQSTPVALFLHNDPQEMKCARQASAREKLLQSCTAIYCISDYIRNRLLEGCSGDASHVHVVHGGIDVPARPVAKVPQILYVGRMTPNKGALEYAEALAQTLPHYPEWKGVMAGGRRHQVTESLCPYEQKIYAQMDALDAQAIHHGFLPYAETLECFAKASIVVVPSMWDEPYGRTALEAIAHGCALVTSGRGGLAEIVSDCGIVLEDVTPQHISKALCILLDDPKTLEDFQNKGYERAQAFTLDECSARLDRIRETTLNVRKSQHAA
ncbi:MAG: glycosyltransferase family 4 protein [Rickettsiales bacterium]|nr:glycosyltransferase family 4 protein [Rickettsiales bacterium]